MYSCTWHFLKEIFFSTDGTAIARLAQLLAALRIVAGIRLTSQESRLWLLFLTKTDCNCDQYISIAISTIIAFPQLIP